MRHWRTGSAAAAAFTGRDGSTAGQWVTLATGAPILKDALAAFDCLIEEVIERHSHAIVLGAVVSLKEGPDEPALAHWRGEMSPALTAPAKPIGRRRQTKASPVTASSAAGDDVEE